MKDAKGSSRGILKVPVDAEHKDHFPKSRPVADEKLKKTVASFLRKAKRHEKKIEQICDALEIKTTHKFK